MSSVQGRQAELMNEFYSDVLPSSNDIAGSDYHRTGKLPLLEPSKGIKISSAPFHLQQFLLINLSLRYNENTLLHNLTEDRQFLRLKKSQRNRLVLPVDRNSEAFYVRSTHDRKASVSRFEDLYSRARNSLSVKHASLKFPVHIRYRELIIESGNIFFSNGVSVNDVAIDEGCRNPSYRTERRHEIDNAAKGKRRE